MMEEMSYFIFSPLTVGVSLLASLENNSTSFRNSEQVVLATYITNFITEQFSEAAA